MAVARERPKTKLKKKAPPPSSRSDAAQRTGARTLKPKPVAGPPTPTRLRSPAAQERQRQVIKQRIIVRNTPAVPIHDTHESRSTPEVAAAVREARLRYLRRTRKQIDIGKGIDVATGAVKKQAVKELEGRGELAKLLGKVGNYSANVSIKNDATARLGLTGDSSKIVSNAARDALNLPAQVVPSVYVPAAGVVEAAQGRPERIKRFVKDIKRSDPVYALVTGHPDKAVRLVKQHPGYAVAEGYGLRGAVGRGAGAAMRSGALGKSVKKAASTERPPARLEGTDLEVPRQYPKDVIRKGLQVNRESGKRKDAQELRARAEKVERSDRPNAGQEAAELRAKARRVDPDVVSSREIKRRVDERVAVNEDLRREHRTQVTAQVRKALKPAKRGKGATSLVVQNITRASKEDLAAYLDQLKVERPGLDRAGQHANSQLQRALRRAIDRGEMEGIQQAAKAYTDVVAPLERKLTEREVLNTDQAAKAKLIPYAVQHMGARHKKGVGMVDEEGHPISTDQIRAHMEKSGVEEPAFVTQAPNQRGAKNFNIRSEKVQGLRQGKRTGAATRTGTFDAHPETLVENAARMQGLVDATDGFRGFVKEFSHKRDGKVKTYGTRKQAEKAASNLGLPGEQQWRPIRINPFAGSKEQLQSLLEDTGSESQMARSASGDSPVVEAQKAALRGEGEGPWALIPEEAASRLQEHLNSMGAGAGGKVVQLVNQSFRKSVLATSPSWAAGNVIEAGFRTALVKAGPTSYLRGRKVLREAGEEGAARMVGGGYSAFADRQVRRSAEQFTGTAIEGMAQALGKFWRNPGPKHIAMAWHMWTHFAFNSMRLVESQFQTAQLGRAAKDMGLFKPGTLELSRKAVDEASQGLTNTATQVALGRAVDRMYGKYGKWSPVERSIIASYTPFMAWTRNAALFVGDVLPKDHPVALAVIAASERATEDWRKEHGRDLFAQGAVPGFLQGSIPVSGDGSQRSPNRFLPFGAFGDPTGTAAGLILPQARSTLFAMMGMDWKGTKLRGKDGNELDPLGKGEAAAKAFLESTVPVLAQGGRVAEGGIGKLNPFSVTKPPAKTRKSSGWKPATPRARSTPEKGFFGGSGSGAPKDGYFKGSGSSSGGRTGGGAPSGGFF